MRLKNGRMLKLYIFISFIMIGFLGLALIIGSNESSLYKEDISELNKSWESENLLNQDSLNLPTRIKIPEGTPATIHKVLDDSFKESQTLLIRSSLANIEVLLDSKEIHINTRERKSLLNKPLASTWHLITLPSESNGKNLTISYFSPFEEMHGLLNPVLYGNRGDLILHLIKEKAFIVMTDLIILFLGIVLIIFSINFTGETKQSIASIGFFSVILSFWMLSETRMLQFFTSNEMIIGSLPYLSLSLAAIPLIVYIKSILNEENKIFDFFISIFILNTLMIIGFQLFGVKEFFETMIVTHSLIGLLIMFTLYILYKSIWNKNEKDLKYLVIGLIVFTVFVSIELIQFYLLGIKTVSYFVRIGVILFVSIVGYGSIKTYIEHMGKSYKSEIYRELAYKDSMTGGNNRMAFQKEIEYLFKNKNLLKNLCIIIFDLNNLKKINDEYGHVSGDQGIIEAYNCIEKHFKSLGSCYRIGGDEFACLLKINNKSDFRKKMKAFKKSVKEKNRTFEFPFYIASGYAFYNSEIDHSPKELIHRGDLEMYKDKYSQKKTIKIIKRKELID